MARADQVKMMSCFTWLELVTFHCDEDWKVGNEEG